VQVHHCKAKFDADHLAGTKLDESHYDVLLGGDEPCDVLKPDGTPLVKYRPHWFSGELCRSVLPACRSAATETDQRGLAAGDLSSVKLRKRDAALQGPHGKTSLRAIKTDGTVSNTTRAGLVNSGIIGYFDRSARYPFCRQTSFVIKEAASWKRFLPYIERADEGFREFMPDRWAAQREYSNRTASDWVIPQSTFTTVTVNKNFQTATHKDAGDLACGFGVMSCLRNDKYDGAYLVFPAYRVAVNLGHGCLCLADVHEWHSNTSFTRMRVGYERITLVFYYRENMIHCKDAKAEVNRVKNRKRGDPLHR
jgi:hypothetical protein